MSKFPAYFLGIHNLLVGRTKEMDEQVLAAVNSAGVTQLVAESGERQAVTRSCVRVHEEAALLVGFQKSSKLPHCGTARQRGLGVFGLCENPKKIRQNSAKIYLVAKKISKIFAKF